LRVALDCLLLSRGLDLDLERCGPLKVRAIERRVK
jgi:hypothetical protein